MNWNIQNILLVIGLVLLLILPVSVSAKKDKPGVVKGWVNYCAQGGYVGMQVLIPGRQFMVILGEDGNFIFDGVPSGTFNISYAINGRLIYETTDVLVESGKTTDLGEISFCEQVEMETNQEQKLAPDVATVQANCELNPDLAECQDADEDGIIAAKDCDDNNANVGPGALERCDNIDNNCNGKIDEVLNVDMPNGIGVCNKGGIVSVKSCNKGFADCDMNPSNGCETDIYNDSRNCGSCGNACSDLEVCRLGFC